MTDKQTIAVTEGGGPRIFFIRGQRVMLDEDLAALYQLEIDALNLSVARNIGSFTEDFAFQLNPDEFAGLRSQVVNSDREAPYVFTGQGLALLSSILFDEQESQDEHECAPTCSCRN